MTLKNQSASWAAIGATLFLAFAGAEFWLASELASLRVEVQRLREDFSDLKHTKTTLYMNDRPILSDLYKRRY